MGEGAPVQWYVLNNIFHHKPENCTRTQAAAERSVGAAPVRPPKVLPALTRCRVVEHCAPS